MENPVSYSFYKDVYLGNSIPETDFKRIEARAQVQLDQYKRYYKVSGEDEQQNMAICAMADTLYYYETVTNGGMTTSCSVGSVSSSRTVILPDISPKAQSAELYRCAKQYLDIYRGVR